MTFHTRTEAAELLAVKLGRFAGTHPLVLGIPCGGVRMAAVIAGRLGAELDVMLIHKLGAPMEPDHAIGCVDESGHVYLADFAREEGVSRDYVEAERCAQLHALRARRRFYSPMHAAVNCAGRTVILVDDGISTESTAIVAIRSVRLQHPAKVIVATAVAPLDALAHVENEADDVVYLAAPSASYATGQFFKEFPRHCAAEVLATYHCH